MDAPIDRQTGISIGLAITVVGSFLAGAVWINSSLKSLEHNVELYGRDVMQIKQDLMDEEGRTWKTMQQKVWALELKNMNAEIGLEVPVVE